MIFSKSRDFLFIKGKKVAGTSVEMALAAVCGPEDIITPITPIDELERLRAGARGAQNYSPSPLREQMYLARLLSAGSSGTLPATAPRESKYKQHMSLMKFAEAYGSLPITRVFCVERCPYAKVISSANMANDNFNSYRAEGKTMKSEIDDLRKVIGRRMNGRALLSCRNIHRYRDKGGAIPVRILRYERLETEFAELMQSYGIRPAPALPHAKPGMNSNEIDPQEVFTRGQLDYINQEFAEEFEVFGYARL